MIINPGVVGIDVSKHRLDIFDGAVGRVGACENGEDGLAPLVRRWATAKAFVVFEASTTSSKPLLHMVRRVERSPDANNSKRATRGAASLAAAPPPRKPAPTPVEPHGYITDETLAHLREHYRGWDFHALHVDFSAWIHSDPDRKPDRYQSAFIGYVRRFHEKNRHQLTGGYHAAVPEVTCALTAKAPPAHPFDLASRQPWKFEPCWSRAPRIRFNRPNAPQLKPAPTPAFDTSGTRDGTSGTEARHFGNGGSIHPERFPVTSGTLWSVSSSN